MNLFFIFGNNSRLDNLLLKLTDLWNIRIEVQSHNEFGPTVFSLSANRVLFSNTWGRLGHMRRKKNVDPCTVLFSLCWIVTVIISFFFYKHGLQNPVFCIILCIRRPKVSTNQAYSICLHFKIASKFWEKWKTKSPFKINWPLVLIILWFWNK